MSNRRADAGLFGFDFQVNAAIVLMLENIKELQSLRLESENEDIDIADATIQMTSAEMVYEASLRATSKVLQTTLLDYI